MARNVQGFDTLYVSGYFLWELIHKDDVSLLETISLHSLYSNE
jgi:hypothetical protein